MKTPFSHSIGENKSSRHLTELLPFVFTVGNQGTDLPKPSWKQQHDTQEQRAEGFAMASPGPGGTASYFTALRCMMKVSFLFIKRFCLSFPGQNTHVKNICDQRTIKDHGQGGKK